VAAAAPPSGMAPGPLDRTAPVPNEQPPHPGQRMLQDQSLARNIGQDNPSIQNRVRQTPNSGYMQLAQGGAGLQHLRHSQSAMYGAKHRPP